MLDGLKRGRIEELDLLPGPERETAEGASSKCEPHIVMPVGLVKFFITT